MRAEPHPQPCSALSAWKGAQQLPEFPASFLPPLARAPRLCGGQPFTGPHLSTVPPHQAFLSGSFHAGCGRCCCTPSPASPDAVDHSLTSEASLPPSAMPQFLPLCSPVRFPLSFKPWLHSHGILLPFDLPGGTFLV